MGLIYIAAVVEFGMGGGWGCHPHTWIRQCTTLATKQLRLSLARKLVQNSWISELLDS